MCRHILKQQHGNPACERIGLGTAGFPQVSLLLSHIFLLSLSAQRLHLRLPPCSSLPFSLPGYFSSASFLHATSLNLSRVCLVFFPPFLLLFSSPYSSPSFSLLVSRLQMSNPSTPPQAVSSIVQCEACVKQECVLVCRKSWGGWGGQCVKIKVIIK